MNWTTEALELDALCNKVVKEMGEAFNASSVDRRKEMVEAALQRNASNIVRCAMTTFPLIPTDDAVQSVVLTILDVFKRSVNAPSH